MCVSLQPYRADYYHLVSRRCGLYSPEVRKATYVAGAAYFAAGGTGLLVS